MSELDELKQRLAQVEARLAKLEAERNDARARTNQTSRPLASPTESRQPATQRNAPARPDPRRPAQMPTASNLLAWSAGIAFVLAAVYFVKLVYDAGWLTPTRQIGIALLAGIAAIAVGLRLSRSAQPSASGNQARSYAAFLPAVGIVILYIATYAAHAYHQLVSAGAVLFGIILITAIAVWLHSKYDQTVYALFAIVGAYSFPLFVRANASGIISLIVYYLAWSALFCYFSVREARRLLYIVSLYFAIIGFDIVWRLSASSDQWGQAAVYQFLQFLIFLGTAVYYSVHHRQPMQQGEAIAHGAALFYFYGVEYVLLSEHLPRLAPFVALLSAVLVYGAFWVARRRLAAIQALSASSVLTSAYCSAVTTHIVFFELLPWDYFAWGALVSPFVVWGVRSRDEDGRAFYPVLAAAALVLGVGFLQLLGDGAHTDVPLANLVLFGYAALLYGGYALFKRGLAIAGVEPERPLLYAGHLVFIVAIIKTFDSGLMISLVWALFAISLLAYAASRKDQLVGQSALVVFAASGIKVLLYDLDGSSSLMRVGTLLILGISLYIGGWLYQRVVVSSP
ncbi:MAG: DUF2339 domain-containing protein [Cyanobacteria bacterium P01_A01_bin.135]